VRRQIGIRIVRSDGTAWGTARVEARLESTDGREKVWIDGQPLTTVPLVVEAHAAVGAVTVHRIEIEVPENVPAGAISASIGWDVTTE
jgi:hypothetical protein